MSAEPTVTYLSQGIDYLGFLNAKLRDLKGWATLANELIQNADDAKGATRVTFDVTDGALVVENDARFSDCGDVTPERCRLDQVGDGKICCDFHAFRRVASGHKRQESDTTGAFGIGFISVYQITDRPTLRSGHWQWVLRPEVLETERIEATPLQAAYPATRFEFPWAHTQTPLRTSLGIEPVSSDVVEQMCAELRKALTVAAPFLKRLETLELRRRGQVEWVVRCVRDPSAGEIVVEAGGETRLWKRVTGDFSQEASVLRARYGASIEAKRKTEVTVAVPIDDLPEEGLLYAALPTEHDIALPVLINADFYPSSDRKRILFDQDYQGEWNRAAIRAAARALSDALPELRESLEPTDLWELFQSAKELHQAAAINAVDKAFSAFWECVAPVVEVGEYVRTTSGDWCSPARVRLLQNAKDEASVLPLLELLGTNVVHLDLKPFATLLHDKEVGVGYLTLDDLTGALLGGGYDQQLPLEQAATWLRSADNRADLGLEVDRLLERVAKDAKVGARERACRCAVVLTTQGAFAPASQLRRSDIATREVFSDVAPDHYWASEDNSPELLSLVSSFSVRDAIGLLKQAGSKQMAAFSPVDSGRIKKLISWLAENRSSIAASADLQDAIRALSIWPSGGELCSLDELSVPGGFEDRLKLAKILDPEISTRWPSFLLGDLGAQELTLRTYLKEHVPRAFDQEPLPSFETRRALLRLLVDHAGDLLDDRGVAATLRSLPIVECRDGAFYQPIGTYFESDLVREMFGSTVRVAKVPADRQEASRDVLAWLGVSSLPRANDVLRRIDDLTEKGPSQDRREGIRKLFKGLAENWDALADQHDELEELQHAQWLPGNRSMDWLPPSGVYSVFSRFLFETQAEFLDVPMPVQRKAADGLLGFLEIQSEPDVVLVVRHLLQLAQQGVEVNMQVYEFLNRNSSDPKINLLKGETCLYLADKRYVAGTQCFWGMHPFGKFRTHLSDDWRKYQQLLTRLGVSEIPAASDARQVLREISEAYADNRQLEDDDHTVVMNCWSILSDHLDGEPDLPEALGNLKVVPNANHFLRKPIEMFFDDRPGLADKFDDAFRKMIIRRPETAWRAMNAAGIKFLSSAVLVDLVECAEPAADEAMAQRFLERWPLVRRVFATLTDMPTGLLSPPELWGSDRLTVSYRILNYPGPTEDVVAHLTESRDRLYYCRDRLNIWGAIARELAFGFHPDASAGPLAAAIKEVLQSADADEARAELDDLGIPDVDLESTRGQGGEDVGLGFGAGEDYESDDESLDWKESGSEEGEGEADAEEDESEIGTSGETSDTESDRNRDKSLPRNVTTREKSEKIGRKPPSGKTTRDGYSFVGKSYLKREAEDEDQGMNEEAKARRDNADRQGVDKVLSSERLAGRHPTEMPHDNEGFDIESRDSDGQIVRYIEVKSLTGPWNDFGVKMSAPQFRMAQEKEKREIYWLYVVEKAASADAKIYRIQNPASQVVEYRFDDGWQVVAEVEEAPGRSSIRDVFKRRLGANEESEAASENNEEPQLEED